MTEMLRGTEELTRWILPAPSAATDVRQPRTAPQGRNAVPAQPTGTPTLAQVHGAGTIQHNQHVTPPPHSQNPWIHAPPGSRLLQIFGRPSLNSLSLYT